MKHINDAEFVSQLVKQHQLYRYFDSTDLTFQCLKFQKGEILCSPLNPIGYLLFLIHGAVQIYALHPDGWKRPVAPTVKTVGQIFGDIEFGCGKPTPFFAEATEETLCLALSIGDHLEQLHRDIRFLHHLLRSMSEKFERYLSVDFPTATLKEKLLSFLESLPDCELSNIEETALQLRCSRRQLQRILQKLCEDGTLQKVGRGRYRAQ